MKNLFGLNINLTERIIFLLKATFEIEWKTTN